jgi:hypothetical protein
MGCIGRLYYLAAIAAIFNFCAADVVTALTAAVHGLLMYQELLLGLFVIRGVCCCGCCYLWCCGE